MSNISDDKIKTLSSEVHKLKNDCMTHFDNSNNEMAAECVRQIKIRHGEAIKLLSNLSASTNLANESDKIKLSNSSCLVDLIKLSLDKCVTKLYNTKSSESPVTISINVSTDDVETVKATEQPQSQAGGNNHQSIVFSQLSDHSEFIGSASTNNLTEFIDKLNTERANNLFSTDSRITIENISNSSNQFGGFDLNNLNPELPTLVNFWKDNCGHSTRYLDTWARVKESLSTSHPELQLLDVNASKYPGMFEKLQKIGIVGYPTTVLFTGAATKKHVKLVGNVPLEEVLKFVTENM